MTSVFQSLICFPRFTMLDVVAVGRWCQPIWLQVHQADAGGQPRRCSHQQQCQWSFLGMIYFCVYIYIYQTGVPNSSLLTYIGAVLCLGIILIFFLPWHSYTCNDPEYLMQKFQLWWPGTCRVSRTWLPRYLTASASHSHSSQSAALPEGSTVPLTLQSGEPLWSGSAVLALHFSIYRSEYELM